MKKSDIILILKRDILLFVVHVFLPSTLFLGLLLLLAKLNEIDFSDFSRDPANFSNSRPYIGLLSNLGVIFWCFTVSILFFSAKLAHEIGKPKLLYYFFFFSGLLTLIMMLDDLFMIHEVVFPEYFHLSEEVFYVAYGLSVLAILFFFRNVILDSNFILFLLAFGLFASSVLIDLVELLDIRVPSHYLFEDGFKFIGIICWFVYFTRMCYDAVLTQKRKEASPSTTVLYK